MHCVNEQSMPFFLLFAVKNAEYDSFNQRLECAALKRWSKYTTLSNKLLSSRCVSDCNAQQLVFL